MNSFSARFARNVWLTRHARSALEKRGLDEETVLAVIETGEIIEKGDGHCWIHSSVQDREDNRICAAVVIDTAVVVKTVMVNWQVKENAP